jgi:hypothetical protein
MANKIIRPQGRIAKEIRITSDERGVIQVFPWDIDRFGNKTPMDTREMVLGLMKIVMDTTAALLGAPGGAAFIKQEERLTNAQTESSDNEGVSGRGRDGGGESA